MAAEAFELVSETVLIIPDFYCIYAKKFQMMI